MALRMVWALGDAFADMCNGDGKYAFYVRTREHGRDIMADPNTLSAIDAATAIRTGQLTSERLVEACLARIDERENTVGAWAYINPDQALTEARARDKQEPKGLLHGVPVGIKDVIDTADMPTEYGSPIYKDHQPACDAACVAQVRESGGVILGKTVSTEFATRYAGKTRNPHNTDHTPGGSSSGSGAAVADCMVPLAFGTQTTGSHIRPASYCGIVGYKPSFNMIDRAGLKQLSQSFDTLGVHGRTVKDTALVVAALSDFHVPESAWEIAGRPKIAFCRTPVWDEADAKTQALVEEAASRLGGHGAEVVEVTLPAAFDELAEAHTTISEFEFVAHSLMSAPIFWKCSASTCEAAWNTEWAGPGRSTKPPGRRLHIAPDSWRTFLTVTTSSWRRAFPAKRRGSRKAPAVPSSVNFGHRSAYLASMCLSSKVRLACRSASSFWRHSVKMPAR